MCFLTVSTGDKYDSCMSLERLQLTAAELKNFADQVKQGKNPVCTQHYKHHKRYIHFAISFPCGSSSMGIPVWVCTYNMHSSISISSTDAVIKNLNDERFSIHTFTKIYWCLLVKAPM